MKRMLGIMLLLMVSTGVFAYGGVHYVNSYTKSNGTYVQGHLAGNPGSGIHCHNNICG